MVEDILRAKVRSLMRCLARVQSKLPPTPQALAADLDLQDIVTVNLERAVQLTVDIAAHLIAERGLPAPANMADGFAQLQEQGWISEASAKAMQAAVGFRNVAVHEYRELDWTIVHRIGGQHLDDFRRYVAELNAAGLLSFP